MSTAAARHIPCEAYPAAALALHRAFNGCLQSHSLRDADTGLAKGDIRFDSADHETLHHLFRNIVEAHLIVMAARGKDAQLSYYPGAAPNNQGGTPSWSTVVCSGTNRGGGIERPPRGGQRPPTAYEPCRTFSTRFGRGVSHSPLLDYLCAITTLFYCKG